MPTAVTTATGTTPAAVGTHCESAGHDDHAFAGHLADLLKPVHVPATRLAADRAILEHGVKLRSLVEVVARLQDLDDRAEQSPDARGGRGVYS